MARKSRDESQDDKPQSIDAEVAPKPSLGSGGFTSFALLLNGFSLVSLGVAVQFGSKIAPQLVELGRAFSSQGIAPFHLGLAGFVSFGFGLVHRAARRPHFHVVQEQHHGPDFELVATEFASGLRRVQEAVEVLHDRFASVSQALQGVQQSFASSSSRSSHEPNDAVFRLAAGLDKLHAQVDRNRDTVLEHVDGGVQAIKKSVGEIGSKLSAAAAARRAAPSGDAPAARPAAPSPLASAPAPHAHSVPSAHVPAPQARAAAPYSAPSAPAMDIYSGSAPSAHAAAPQPAPSAKPAPPPARPAPAKPDPDRMVKEGLAALGSMEVAHVEPPPAIPTAPASQAFLGSLQEHPSPASAGHPQPPAPLPVPKAKPKAQAEDKLELLLSDDALRRALGEA